MQNFLPNIIHGHLMLSFEPPKLSLLLITLEAMFRAEYACFFPKYSEINKQKTRGEGETNLWVYKTYFLFKTPSPRKWFLQFCYSFKCMMRKKKTPPLDRVTRWHHPRSATRLFGRSMPWPENMVQISFWDFEGRKNLKRLGGLMVSTRTLPPQKNGFNKHTWSNLDSNIQDL